MSLLPSFLDEVQDAIENDETEVVTIPKEFGIDFKTGRPTGKIVEGTEAIKVWIWNCLKTQRFRHAIYDWQFGLDLEQYIGNVYPDEYLETDLPNEIEEALKVHPNITGIDNFQFVRTGAEVKATFTVLTDLGNIDEEVNLYV